MRFYNIVITDKNNKPMMPASLYGIGATTITSKLPNGQTNPAALNVEFDIPVAFQHTPDEGTMVRIWGLGLKDIGTAFDLFGANITIYGGMEKGLPFANPAQQGILTKGKVLKAFGNWIGLEQTVDLIITPGSGTNDAPLNLVLDWKAGTSLKSALTTAITTALPNAKQDIQISDRLVQNHDEPSFHATISQLAQLLYPLSKSIITDDNYHGVNIAYDGITVKAMDFTPAASPPVAIAIQDLIGQPTWIDFRTIQVKVVLRGDLEIGQHISIPPGLQTTTGTSNPNFGGTSFSGTFRIVKLHHYGNFRQQSSEDWNTTIEMIADKT